MGRRGDERRFVQIAERPSLGVELPSGRGWVGVDRQVGHGSADALFALTDAQYAGALVDAWTTLHGFEGECWRGEHPELELFGPGARWRPDGWLPRRARMLPQAFEGELWRLVDALEERGDGGERMAVAQALADGALQVETTPAGGRRLAVRLVGDDAYPRPSALVGGLGAGSTREDAARILGAAIEPDAYAVEGCLVRLRHDRDGGLEGLSLEPRPTPPAPGGGVGTVLSVVGEPEEGDAFAAVAALVGGEARRWMATPDLPARLVSFDGGVDVHVRGPRVHGVRVDLVMVAASLEAAGSDGDGLVSGAPALATRAEVRRALGAPLVAVGSVDLHRFGGRDLLVHHDGPGDDAIATALTAVLVGVSVPERFLRWRSGDLSRFLDVLGRPADDPLAVALTRRSDVRVRLRSGKVDAVEIDAPGSAATRFLDGMPAAPERGDVPLGWPPYALEREDVWAYEQGWVRVEAPDGRTIRRIVVQREQPRGLGREGAGRAWWGERFGERARRR